MSNDSDEEMTINRRKIKKKVPTQQQQADLDDPNPPSVRRPNQQQQDIYSMDDPCEETKEVPQDQNKKEEAYDLNKGLSLTVSADRKVIRCSKLQSQKLTTVISLRTLEVTSQENQNLEELAPSESRLPIDLIAVIDTSGSMSSQNKMQNARDAIMALIPFFSEKDRFAIVKFDSSAHKIMGLKRVRPLEYDSMYKDVIQGKLNPSGSTSIPEGIKTAVNIIRDRGAHKNKIVSIFLLSDGNDNDREASDVIKKFLEINAVDLEFTIHTFGFGDDHDSKLLSDIAKFRGGNFYYIQDLEKINECFVNAFGGLLSIVGRDAQLQVKLEKSHPHLQELSDLKWLKPYGDFWVLNEQTNNYEIQIQNLMNGMKRDYVLDLQIPKVAAQISKEHREQLILSCVLSAKSIEGTQIIKTAELKVNFIEEEEESKEETEVLSEEVVFNIFRVEVGEMLISARLLAEQNKNDQAIKDLEMLINKILVSKYGKNANLQKLVEQLEIAKENVKPEIFNDYGKHDLINEGERTMKQTGLKTKKLKKKPEQAPVQAPQKNDSDSDDNENTIQRTMKRKIQQKPPMKPQPQEIVGGLSTVLEQSDIKEMGTSMIEGKK